MTASAHYDPAVSMGHPSMTSMADLARTDDGRSLAVAVEQVAFELRTANLIQFLRDNGAHDPALTREVRIRLGLDPLGDANQTATTAAAGETF